MFQTRIFSFLVIVAGLVGCSTNRTSTVGQNPNPVTQEEQRAARTQGSHIVSSISFNRGDSTLSQRAKEELNTAIWKARQEGEVDKVIVSAWSDEPYPRNNQRLPQSQVNLADERAKNVEKYLQDNLDVSNVETHNMGKTPNVLQETFNTADAALKEELQKQGVVNNEGNRSAPDRRATALIMIRVK